MALHECCLANTAISNKQELELWRSLHSPASIRKFQHPWELFEGVGREIVLVALNRIKKSSRKTKRTLANQYKIPS